MFKVGDIVKCVYDDGCNFLLTKDKIYTVTKLHSKRDYLFLKETGERLWSFSRFELVKACNRSPFQKWENAYA